MKGRQYLPVYKWGRKDSDDSIQSECINSVSKEETSAALLDDQTAQPNGAFIDGRMEERREWL